jgi:hypothetical protein
VQLFGDDDDLTGPEVKNLYRRDRLWLVGLLAVMAAVLVSGWLLWHFSVERLGFLAAGVAALGTAGHMWRTGASWLSYEEGPAPSFIAIPALMAFGIFMTLAATPTAIGSALIPVAAGGEVVSQFGQAAWGVLGTMLLVGVLIAGLFSRDGRGASGCLLVVVAVVAFANFAMIRFTGSAGRGMWNSYLQPFRDMWHLVGR